MPRRSLVFMVSDFISTPGWEKPLSLLARRHELVGVRLHDPAELELPGFGLAVVGRAPCAEAKSGHAKTIPTKRHRMVGETTAPRVSSRSCFISIARSQETPGASVGPPGHIRCFPAPRRRIAL